MTGLSYVEVIGVRGGRALPFGEDLTARVEPQEEEAVGVEVEQGAHVFHEGGAFGGGEVDFMHRFLPAGGVGAQYLERGNQTLWAGNVVGGEVELTLFHRAKPCVGSDCLPV